eukprot:TRINITY_DN4831_c0_g1_i4.p3 TRINITY_DN4831_c0_g1~~TRINITY_DN4831_c0_g1_i4.p3  ORF type:complete len:190 (+),score=40.10 TRINITY_DN4831_c0_g1_i4:79-570(+)
MQACPRADRELVLLRHGRTGTAAWEAVVAKLEPGFGILLAKAGRPKAAAVDGIAEWDHVVPLPRGRTQVRAVGEAVGAHVAFVVTIWRAGESTVEEEWRLGTSTSASAAAWVARLQPWLVSWGDLASCGGGSLLAAPSRCEAVLHASFTATSISKAALELCGR